MTYRPDFSGCQAKLARAWVHRNVLYEEIGHRFLLHPANRIRFAGKFDSESGHYIFKVTDAPELPRVRLGLLVGDVVHNFRCVLDHLVWQLTLVKTGGQELTGSRARRARFPIVIEPDEDIEDIVPEEFAIADALKDVLALHRAIIESLQPYRRREPKRDGLAILRVLSDRDKHRVITPVLVSTPGLHFEEGAAESVEIDAFDFTHATEHLEVGAEIGRAPPSPLADPHVEMTGSATPKVCFPKGEGVITQLNKIYHRVNEVVHAFQVSL
jgi:hypothetical protein